MSLPVTPKEPTFDWTAVVRTERAPSVEIDIDKSTPSTPSSSPLRRALQQELSSTPLHAHRTVALPPSPSTSRRRIIFSNKRDDIALKEILRAKSAEMHGQVDRNALLEQNVEQLNQQMQALTKRVEGMAETLENMRTLMRDKRKVAYNAVLHVVSKSCCPHLRPKKKPHSRANPLKEGLNEFVANPETENYRVYCQTRPTASCLFVPAVIQPFVDFIVPLERHRMSHPEGDHIELVRATFEVVADVEQSTGSASDSDRRVLELLICALGPSAASDIIRLISQVDYGFCERYAVLLDFVRPHLLD